MTESNLEKLKQLTDKLEKERDLSDAEFELMLESEDAEFIEYLTARARKVREENYGKDVYLRGLIEFTNYCRNNCLYCGIRSGNQNVERYRLSEEDIISCSDAGYRLGFRTIVLQGGEDMHYSDEKMVGIIRGIKEKHPDVAVTLSIGERSRESYEKMFEAGADRYLLRHETADKAHYEMLHPNEMSFEHRMNCLKELKEIGYQVGCGMMLGSPYQTNAHLIKDLRFLKEFEPQMVGVGPFIPHHDTPFASFKAGGLDITIKILAMVRLILPKVLLPATTALGTIDPLGREKGLMAGANVVMPNLSPSNVREKYLLYDNKICTGDEAAECIRCMTLRVEKVGYKVVMTRGDHVDF